LSNARISPANDREQSLASVASYVEAWRDPEWQRLWLAIEGKPWLSLALVPAGDGAPLDFTLVVAVTLSRTGMVHLGKPIQVADATQVPLDQLSRFLAEVRRCTGGGDRLLVALPPIGNSPITASIAQAADSALLCVQLDKMSSAQAKRTVKEIGQPRFLGSAIFHPHQVERAR
jgi:hypothetical protein